MKKSTLWLLYAIYIFSILSAKAQSFEPTILILSPYQTKVENGLQKEIDKFNANIKKNKDGADSALESAPDLDTMPNFKIMALKKKEFLQSFDFYSTIPSYSESYLQYRFFEKFQNLLIYAVHDQSSGERNELASLADKQDVQYVINFPSVRSYKKLGAKRTTIRVQLYDNGLKNIILDKEFTGDEKNKGFEFTCDDKSLSCTVINALAQALPEIAKTIATQDPALIAEKNLVQKRMNVLLSEYYLKAPDPEIPRIVSTADTSISTKGFYQGFMNEDRTKFIGFFALNSSAKDIQEMDNQNDGSITIISDDSKDMDNIPGIHAYLVAGIKYNGKWYVKRDKVTNFNAENLETGRKLYFNQLQILDFFKRSSAEFNPDFWDRNLFEKVKDVRQEPDYKKYYESIYKSEERENEGYVSMYKLVADALKKETATENEKFELNISEEVLRPFFEKLKKSRPNEFADYVLLDSTFLLIFPKDKSIVLTPVQIINAQGQRQIRFFVLFPATNEIYEWTYLPSQVLEGENWYYNNVIINKLSSVTDWDFSFKTLDDMNFWNNDILLKENRQYKYLKKIAP